MVSCAWVIGYCGLNAYAPTSESAEQIPMVWGFPKWVVWGIALPWIVSNLFTFWFCLFIMRDDDKPQGGKDA